jgi:hypothetical protein
MCRLGTNGLNFVLQEQFYYTVFTNWGSLTTNVENLVYYHVIGL